MQTSSSSNSQNSKKAIRRHDIDWLRVILFGFLIPFHVAIGVYWSTYGTDINPNFEELSGEDREEFAENNNDYTAESVTCLLYTSPSPRDRQKPRMPSSA